MKVLNYAAHNVQGVSDIKFDLEGHHLYLVGGGNGQGKSSALKALLMALCGRQGCDYPEVSLKEGETEGHVRVKLSGDADMHDDAGFTVELLLKRKRDKSVVEEFRILDSSGDEAPEPRTLLKKLFKLKAFDPLSFEKMDKKAKKQLLQELTGLDFSKQNAEAKKVYDERTIVNREIKKLEAQFEALPKHEGVPAEEVASADLLAKLEERQKTNKANAATRKSLAEDKEDLAETRDRIAALTVQITNLIGQRDALRVIADEKASNLADLEAKVTTLKDEDETEIRTQMKELDATNAKVRANKKYHQTREELETKVSESERLTKQLIDIAENQKKAIAEAKFPVEGMSFDEEGVLYNGLPFEQVNKAARVMASVDVGMALNPTLRLLVCECGGDLDSETLAALEAKLREHDFQMLVEIVTRTEADEKLCQVVIKDGKVR